MKTPGLYVRDHEVVEEVNQILGELRRLKPRTRVSRNAIASALLIVALQTPAIRQKALSAIS